MEKQARHVYKKVESGNIININTLKKEIEQDWELSKLDDTSRDINPYRELIVNNKEKTETVLSQMEQWSILSNVVNHIQYDRHPKNFQNLNISAVNKEKYKRNSNIEWRKNVINRFWRHTSKNKGRIYRCVWRDTIKITKHYKVWWKFRFKYNILWKGRHNQK